MDDRQLTGKTFKEVLKHCEPKTDLEKYLVKYIDENQLSDEGCDECTSLGIQLDCRDDQISYIENIANGLYEDVEDDDFKNIFQDAFKRMQEYF